MPTSTGIIDLLSTPPFASLQQVLDTNGPYGPGDYTLSSFTTTGGFLLPAGTYDLGAGVYGVLVQVTSVPSTTGLNFGWNDATFPTASGDEYLDRMVQVCLLHQLPITGAYVITDVRDIHLVQELLLWPFLLGSTAKLGVHVNPGFECDLFFMVIV